MRIKIIGSGLAGLAAGIHILEKNPKADVEIINMGHHVGGRATSWRDSKGHNINHGFHVIFKNYHNFLSLLKKSGIDIKSTLILKKSNYFYEPDSGKVHKFGTFPIFSSLKKGYKNGYNPSNSIRFSSFFVRNRNTIFKDDDIEKYDDRCFTKWALENNFNPKMLNKRTFRSLKDALFNWPHEISAYIAMKSLRLIGNGKFYLVNGHYGEHIIKPIEDYYKKLGGKITLYKKLVSINYKKKHVVSLTLANPDPAPHDFGKKLWTKTVPIVVGSEYQVKEFDKVIVTVPIDSFKELNKNDKLFWEEFKGISNLQSVATINWQIWLKERAMPKIKASINGLDEPMGTVIDHKDLIDEYKNDSTYGSVLEFVGQATSFEHLSDDEVKELVMKNFAKIPGTKDIETCGILHEKFTRNASNHERFLLTEPGTLKFRPKSNTSYDNLFLAGDWIRNAIDVPTMEGAVCSGLEAANNCTS